MYYYTEVLRAMRALRVIAIILAVALAMAMLFRLWAFTQHDPQAFVRTMQASPTAHVTTKTLADGTVETVVDDPPQQIHSVIDRNGWYLHIDATMPASAMAGYSHFSTVHAVIDKKTGVRHVIVTENMNARIPLGLLFAISEVMGLVAASMLGGVLAKENDGHLEVAWTKPVSRERLALASITVDMAAIWVSQFGMILLTLAVCAMFVWPAFYVDALTLPTIAIALLGPIAWYACLTAASASLKRGLGMVVGLGWLAALVIPSVAAATAGSTSDFGRALYGIFQAVSIIDPIQYVHLSYHGSFGITGMQSMQNTAIGPLGNSALMLLILTIVYVAAAVLQWRRVEG